MEVLGFVPDDLREGRRLQAGALKRGAWARGALATAPGPAGRPASLVVPAGPRPGAQAVGGPAGQDPRVPLARAGGLRVPGPGVDVRPDRPGDRGGVRGHVPQGSRRPTPEGPGVDPASPRSPRPASGT